MAIGVVSESDSSPSLASDGGLSPAARSWMEATAGATVEDARAYDRETQPYREVTRHGQLQPRGPAGDAANYMRSVEMNEARQAVREYRRLEDLTD